MRWWISTSWSGGCGAGCPKALLERRHERVGERAPRMVFGHDHFEIPLRAGRVVARAIDGFDGETRLPRHIGIRSEEHTSELQSHSDLVCRLLLEKKKKA